VDASMAAMTSHTETPGVHYYYYHHYHHHPDLPPMTSPMTGGGGGDVGERRDSYQ